MPWDDTARAEHTRENRSLSNRFDRCRMGNHQTAAATGQNRWDDHARQNCVRFSTQSSTWPAAVASGACCPATSRRCRLFRAISITGPTRVCWKTINCLLVLNTRELEGRESQSNGRSDRQPKRQKPLKAGAFADMTPEKRVKGRKRHIVVDTIGLLLFVIVTAAQHSGPRWRMRAHQGHSLPVPLVASPVCR